jgi:hypothetical protein
VFSSRGPVQTPSQAWVKVVWGEDVEEGAGGEGAGKGEEDGSVDGLGGSGVSVG